MEGKCKSPAPDFDKEEYIRKYEKALMEGLCKQMVQRLGLKNGQELVEKMQSLSRMESLTPQLLFFIKANHLSIVKFFIEEDTEYVGQMGEFVWKGVEYVEVPPLFAAILSDQTTHIEIVSLLVDQDLLNKSPAVVDPILQSITIPRLQKIDMLELMGAAYILRSYQGKGSQFGLLCWKHAMILRQSIEDGEPLPKILEDMCERNKKIFENATEISTLEQLDEFLRDLTANPGNSQLLLLLEAQAILVTHRIMSRIHPEPNPFFLYHFYYYAKQRSFVQGKWSCFIDASMFALEPFEARDWKDVEDAVDDQPFGKIYLYLFLMSIAFQFMEQLPPNDPDREMLTVDNLFKTLRYVCAYVDKRDSDHLERGSQHILQVAYRIIPLLVEKLRQHIQQPDQQIQESIKKYIKDVDKLPGVRTLIHLLVCSSPEVPIDVLQLLLKAKANPNSVDCKGDTPLHYLSHNWHCVNVDKAAKVLVDAGAHLDQSNSFGESALEFFKQMQVKNVKGMRHGSYRCNLRPLINSVLPLSCLAAQVIRENCVPFENPKIPASVESFIKSHDLKGTPLRMHRCRCDDHEPFEF